MATETESGTYAVTGSFDFMSQTIQKIKRFSKMNQHKKSEHLKLSMKLENKN